MPASFSNALTAESVSFRLYSLPGCLYSPSSMSTARLHNSGTGLRIPIKPYNMSLVNWMTKLAEDGWELVGHCGALFFNRSVARVAQPAGLTGLRPSTTALDRPQPSPSHPPRHT